MFLEKKISGYSKPEWNIFSEGVSLHLAELLPLIFNALHNLTLQAYRMAGIFSGATYAERSSQQEDEKGMLEAACPQAVRAGLVNSGGVGAPRLHPCYFLRSMDYKQLKVKTTTG
jgi:hypothetical protein